jgi:DNA helicase IV
MNSQDKLKAEEQNDFNGIVSALDKAKDNAQKILGCQNLSELSKEGDDADAYPDVQAKAGSIKNGLIDINDIKKAEKQLYIAHIVLDSKEKETGEKKQEDMFIGKHGYTDTNDKNCKIIIYSWNSPVAMHYLQMNPELEMNYRHSGNDGELNTEYVLKNRRDLTIIKRKIEKVDELYSCDMDSDEITKAYEDAFLKDIADRRGKGLQDIILTIQKEQYSIIREPFEQNLYVQGCAGSGKSMIMLHRLPVLLYDESNEKIRTGIRVITPSEAYIDSIKDLVDELEIKDIPCSTLDEYFDERVQAINYINTKMVILPRHTNIIKKKNAGLHLF